MGIYEYFKSSFLLSDSDGSFLLQGLHHVFNDIGVIGGVELITI